MFWNLLWAVLALIGINLLFSIRRLLRGIHGNLNVMENDIDAIRAKTAPSMSEIMRD